MKKRVSILAVCLVALLWATPAPRSVRATHWVDELSPYIDDYGTDWFGCWETAWDASAQCQSYPAGPDRDNCESGVNSDKVTCLSSSSNIFRSRAGGVNYDYAELDFCTNAQFLAASCANEFQGLDNWEAYMECRAASKIDLCQ
jgi:hypothetical protein